MSPAAVLNEAFRKHVGNDMFADILCLEYSDVTRTQVIHKSFLSHIATMRKYRVVLEGEICFYFILSLKSFMCFYFIR